MNNVSDFISHLSGLGFIIPYHQPGSIIRCSTESCKTRSDTPGWFIYDIDEGKCHGAYGDWREGITYYWPEQKLEYNIKKRLIKPLKIETEDIIIRSLAFQADYNLYENLDDHPYLEKKQIKIDLIQDLIKINKSNLCIPIYNIDKQIVGIQKINFTGDKKISFGSILKGSFFIFPSENKDKIIICEGFATGYAIWKSINKTVICALTCTNYEHVMIALKSRYPDSKLIIAADNDENQAGLLSAQRATEKFKSTIIVPKEENSDFNDIFIKGGESAVRKYFHDLTPLLQIGFMFHNPKWMIKNFIQADCNFCIFGKGGSGKSFVALYLLMCVVNNRDFFNMEVDKTEGYGIYVCGEDFSYSNARGKALCKQYGFDDSKIAITTAPVHFLNIQMLDELIDNIETLKLQGKHLKMIVIDTLNANFGNGDENKTEDMTKFINALQRIRIISPNVCIGIIHHTSKANENVARGNGALYGNVAAEFKVHMEEQTKDIWITSTKEKNAPKSQPISGKLKSLTLDHTDINTGEIFKIDTAYFEEDMNLNVNQKDINNLNQLTEPPKINIQKYQEIIHAIHLEMEKQPSNHMFEIDIIKIIDLFVKDSYLYFGKLLEEKKISSTEKNNIYVINN